MRFDIVPYEGVLPLKFGMTSDEVQLALKSKPISARPKNQYGGPRDEYHFVGINYDDDGRSAEFCFGPTAGLDLYMNGVKLIGQDAIAEPAAFLRKLDPAPEETHGFLVFKKIGINTTGYHDDDRSQRAINVFKSGYWDNV